MVEKTDALQGRSRSLGNLPKLSLFKPLRWLGGIIVIAVIYSGITVVPAGTVGVYDLFGKVSEQVVMPGIHFVNPLASIHKMSVRTQEVKETVDVPSREGLTIKVDVSLLFSLAPQQGPQVFRTTGNDYVNIGRRENGSKPRELQTTRPSSIRG